MFESAGVLVLRGPVQYAFALRTGRVKGEGIDVGQMWSGAGWLVILVSMLMPAVSWAASPVYFKIGEDLKISCEGTAAGEENASTAEYLLCLGYLQAVVDTDATFAEWGELPRRACIPQGVTSSQLRLVFLDWLNERPDYLHFSAASLALTAFSETWPCKKQ